ncbi:MAG: endonuclease/exonuclease/phosphatase family protein, partial [Gemmatimonadaceae bacterium]|nr:endonuclease/exonuclease/phosphatase family protein [Chitinophagaceae bacterium]
MAFRKKAGLIFDEAPDILIVPECECPEKLKLRPDLPFPTSVLWYGVNPHKGLAVFSFGPYKLKLLKTHNESISIILPIEVTGGAFNFTLIATWAYNNHDKGYNYIGQVWKAIEHYAKILKRKNVIIAGDFNSNVFWDKLKRKVSHTMVVKKLSEMGIHSTYHGFLNLE